MRKSSVHRTIEASLASHGYRKAAGFAYSDLAVSYHVVLKRQLSARVSDYGVRLCGWRGCIRGWSGTPTLTSYNYTQGSLVIDLVDRRSGELVWRAALEDRVTQSDLSQDRINAMVAKMMRSLPKI